MRLKSLNKSGKWVEFIQSAIIVLLLLAGILGGTIFDPVQIFVEVLAIILLIYSISINKMLIPDLVLIFILLFASLVSLILNPLMAFLLNFKLFALSILTFINFKNSIFYPKKFIITLLVINILLILFQFITGSFIVPSGWFLSYYQGYTNDRPLGLFLTPHASSFFLYIYLIYLIHTSKHFKYKFFIFLTSLATQSYTSLISFIVQLGDYIVSKSKVLKILFPKNFIIWFITILLILLFFFVDDFIELLEQSGGVTRYYSAKIILEQLFEPEYYQVFYTNLYPIRYADYFEVSGVNIESKASEVGLIKVIVEGGSILGVLTLFFLLQKLKIFRIFILVSLMHYTHIISTPFFLYLMLCYNNLIVSRKFNKISNE